MPRLRYSQDARADLRQIGRYIAQDKPDAVRTVDREDQIEVRFRGEQFGPWRGASRLGRGCEVHACGQLRHLLSLLGRRSGDFARNPRRPRHSATVIAVGHECSETNSAADKGLLNAVQFAVFFLQMLHQRGGRQFLPGHPLNELRRRIPLSMAMNLLAQPFPQRAELASGELSVRGRRARGRPWRRIGPRRDCPASTWGNSPPSPHSSERPASRRRRRSRKQGRGTDGTFRAKPPERRLPQDRRKAVPAPARSG